MSTESAMQNVPTHVVPHDVMARHTAPVLDVKPVRQQMSPPVQLAPDRHSTGVPLQLPRSVQVPPPAL